MMKTIMLAAVAASALALHTTSASAQASPVYGSPAQARTSGEASGALSQARLHRMVRHARGFETFAAAPRQPSVWDKHTANIGSY
jgi:hypothetical protein